MFHNKHIIMLYIEYLEAGNVQILRTGKCGITSYSIQMFWSFYYIYTFLESISMACVALYK